MAAAAAAAARDREATVKWKNSDKYGKMSRTELRPLINEDFCIGYRDLECQPEGGCSFEQVMKHHFKRNVKFDESVFNARRFACDSNRGKVGVIVYSPDFTHIMLVKSFGNLWGIPKGSFEKSDTDPLSGSQRELVEETGEWARAISIYHLVPSGIVPEKSKFYSVKFDKDEVFLFYCTVDMTITPKLSDLVDVDHEITEINWFPVDHLPADLNKFTRLVLEQVNRNLVVAENGTIA